MLTTQQFAKAAIRHFRQYFHCYHPQEDFGYAQFVSYGYGASMRQSPSASIWLVAGTWTD